MGLCRLTPIAAVVAGIAVTKRLAFGRSGRDPKSESVDTTDEQSDDAAAEAEQMAIVRMNVQGIFDRVIANATEQHHKEQLQNTNAELEKAKLAMQEMTKTHDSEMAAKAAENKDMMSARDLRIIDIESQLLDAKLSVNKNTILLLKETAAKDEMESALKQELTCVRQQLMDEQIAHVQSTATIRSLEDTIKYNKVLVDEKDKELTSLAEYVVTLKNEGMTVRDELAKGMLRVRQDGIKMLALDDAARTSAAELRALKTQVLDEKAQYEMDAAKEKAAALSDQKENLEKCLYEEKVSELNAQRAAIEDAASRAEVAALDKLRHSLVREHSQTLALELEKQREALLEESQKRTNDALLSMKNSLTSEKEDALQSLGRKLKAEFDVERLQTIEKLQGDLTGAAEMTLTTKLTDLEQKLGQEHAEATMLAVKEVKEHERAAQMDDKNAALLQQREQLLRESHDTLQEELERQRVSLTNAFESEQAVRLEEQRAAMRVAEEQRLALALEEQESRMMTDSFSNQTKAIDELRENLMCEMEEKLDAQKKELTDAAASTLERTICEHQQELNYLEHAIADFEHANTKRLEDLIATLSSKFGAGHQGKLDEAQVTHDGTDVADALVNSTASGKTLTVKAPPPPPNRYPVNTEEAFVDAMVKTSNNSVTAQNGATVASREDTQETANNPLHEEEASVDVIVETKDENATARNKETTESNTTTTKPSSVSNAVALRSSRDRSSFTTSQGRQYSSGTSGTCNEKLDDVIPGDDDTQVKAQDMSEAAHICGSTTSRPFNQNRAQKVRRRLSFDDL